ncbi:MAG TPA: DMT family transporter, partial [Spirochaetia bacterium]|nr:DMT family transporter [Spirochaetia bacterium]
MTRVADSRISQPLRTPTPRIAVLVAVLFTSSSAILIRLSNAPPLAIAAWRMTLSALLMLPAMLWTMRVDRPAVGGTRRLTGKDVGWCIASGFFLALHFASWITSLSYTSVAAATVLVDTHPIFVVALSAIFLKERIRRVSLGLVLVALMGSVLLAIDSGNGSRGTIYGNGLALFGAAAVSGYLLIGRIVRPRLGVTQYTFLVYASAALMLLLLCLVTGT